MEDFIGRQGLFVINDPNNPFTYDHGCFNLDEMLTSGNAVSYVQN